VPAAASGIFTGVILGTGRAIGETLAVSYVIGGNVFNYPLKVTNVAPYVSFPPTSTITVQLLFDFQEAANPSLDYSAIWTLAFVLLVISFLLVVASRWVASRGAYHPGAGGGGRRLRWFLASVRTPGVTPSVEAAKARKGAE
jgi:phosphate transport system permease protein